ncbi:MAG: Yip1 family protein [Candidatus Gracilibacteria bacterium]|nr:Yip1 family protein [Candidatus Gracilibacteria bacterium]
MEKQTNYAEELKSAWKVVTLKQDVIKKVAAAKEKTPTAFLILIAAALLGLIGGQLFPGFFAPSLKAGTIGAVMSLVQSIIFIYVLSFVAKSMFSGKAAHDAFFRAAAYGMIVAWLAILPSLSILGSLWGLVVTVVVLKVVHQLTTGKAIAALVVGIIAMIVVTLVLSPFYAFMGFNAMGGTYNFGKFGNKNAVMDFMAENFEDNAMQFQTEDGEASVDFENGAMRFETEDGEGTVEFGDGSMTVKTEDGESSMNFEDGTMVIQTEDGETIRVEIPQF